MLRSVDRGQQSSSPDSSIAIGLDAGLSLLTGPDPLAVHRACLRPWAWFRARLSRPCRSSTHRACRPGARQWRHRPDRQYRQCAGHAGAAGGCVDRSGHRASGNVDRLLPHRHCRSPLPGPQPDQGAEGVGSPESAGRVTRARYTCHVPSQARHRRSSPGTIRKPSSSGNNSIRHCLHRRSGRKHL
jgi:hypothetical protein